MDQHRQAIEAALKSLLEIHRDDKEADPRQTFWVLRDLLKEIVGEERYRQLDKQVRDERYYR
jgi:hypothetical protein